MPPLTPSQTHTDTFMQWLHERRDDYLSNLIEWASFHFPVFAFWTCRCTSKVRLHFGNCHESKYFLNCFLQSTAPSLLSLCLYPFCSISLGQILPVLPHIPKQYAGGPCSHRPGGTYVLFLELTPSAHASKVKKKEKPSLHIWFLKELKSVQKAKAYHHYPQIYLNIVCDCLFLFGDKRSICDILFVSLVNSDMKLSPTVSVS